MDVVDLAFAKNTDLVLFRRLSKRFETHLESLKIPQHQTVFTIQRRQFATFLRINNEAPVNFGLIIELAKRDFIERYSGSALGFVWSFIYPLINILIYMVIFGSLMGARLPGMSSVWGYGVYLISGLVPWMAFANTVTRSSTVFLDKKNIISKINVDLPTLPLFILLSETITFCVTFVIFFLLLLITGFVFTPPTPAHSSRISYTAGPCIRTGVLSCDVCRLPPGSQGGGQYWIPDLVLVHPYCLCL